MVRASCFVPGCKSGRLSTLKENKKKGIRNPSMFKPRDLAALEKWKKVIPRTNKEMTMKDYVCELHFEEKNIIRHYEQRLIDGSVFKLERGWPCLTPDAVPALFLCIVSESSKRAGSATKGSTINSNSKTTTRKILPSESHEEHYTTHPIILYAMNNPSEKIKIQEVNSVASLSECDQELHTETESSVKTCTLNDNSSVMKIQEVNSVVSSPGCHQELCTESLDDDSPILKNQEVNSVVSLHGCYQELCTESPDDDSPILKIQEVNSIVSPSLCHQDSTEFNFDYLATNVHKIIKPSDSWGISVINEFFTRYVMCVKWSTYASEKRIIIDNTLKVKVFLKHMEISSSEPNKVTCMEDVVDLLKRVHSYVLCPGMDDKNMTDCAIYLERAYGSYGRPKIWCRACRAARLKYKDCKRKRKLDSFRSYPLLLNRVRAAERRNSRLRKRVIVLKNLLKNAREQCTCTAKHAVKNAISTLSASQQKAVNACIKASRLQNGQVIQYKGKTAPSDTACAFVAATNFPSSVDDSIADGCTGNFSPIQSPNEPQQLKEECIDDF